ncbi:MAG TPA: hypothetical protein PLA50_12695, partial [Bacteroidia bacterium]|nr:hypothetical protein [Bacteroidia bacterium]
GFDAPQVASLIRDATVMADSNTLRVFPDHETVLDMPFAMRTNLYRYLATQPGNEHFRQPIYINSENLSEWFDGSQVPRAAIQDIAKLAFPTPRGRGYYLCDLPFTLRQANSAAEERQLIRGLLRSRALIVRIRLSQDMPLAEIASYWRADYKNKAVLPILESALMADESLALDITHLLPATPRQYLNCFPTLADGINGRFPDWFWTCYNFFQFTPVDVYADSPERDALIQSEFTPTLPPLQFGDMLLLNSGPKAIHGCIYIADDIVFTKNGADLFSPWVLMNLGDVVAHHDRFGDVTISAHRRISSDESGTP